jgi:hypothetical protein
VLFPACSRLCAAAEAVFQYPISQEVLNPWWLVVDQDFLQEYSGAATEFKWPTLLSYCAMSPSGGPKCLIGYATNVSFVANATSV